MAFGPRWGNNGDGTFRPPQLTLKDFGTESGKPEGPTNLRVTNVAAGTISVSWIDQSEKEDGFSIRFRGQRAGFSDHTGTQSVGRNAVSASLTGLRSDSRIHDKRSSLQCWRIAQVE